MMKKSRLLLGITAVTLAVVSAIAAKARQANVTYYYTTAIPPQCVTVSLPAQIGCQTGGTGCLYTDPQGNQWQLYTSKNAAGFCLNPLELIE